MRFDKSGIEARLNQPGKSVVFLEVCVNERDPGQVDSGHLHHRVLGRAIGLTLLHFML